MKMMLQFTCSIELRQSNVLFLASHLASTPVLVEHEQLASLNTFVHPFSVEHNLSFLSSILPVKALTGFLVRVNCIELFKS